MIYCNYFILFFFVAGLGSLQMLLGVPLFLTFFARSTISSPSSFFPSLSPSPSLSSSSENCKERKYASCKMTTPCLRINLRTTCPHTTTNTVHHTMGTCQEGIVTFTHVDRINLQPQVNEKTRRPLKTNTLAHAMKVSTYFNMASE